MRRRFRIEIEAYEGKIKQKKENDKVLIILFKRALYMLSESIVIQSNYFLFWHLMSNLESPSTDPNNYNKDLQLLKMKLGHTQALLNDKRVKIAELQNTIQMMERTQISPHKVTEEETQCSREEDKGQHSSKGLRSLEDVVTHPRKDSIHLHLDTQESEDERAELRQALRVKEQQTSQLRKRIQELEGYLIVNMRDFQFLCNENKTLRDRNFTLQQEKTETERHLTELEVQAQKWEQLKIEKQAVMKERMQMLCQENKVLKEKEQRLKQQLQIQGDELQRMRQALNTYDWKLFCLQTELDLWAKECKQLKFTNQKQILSISQMENLLKDKQITIFSEQQENNLLLQTTKNLTSELSKKKIEIQNLNTQINSLKRELEEGELSKELSYSLKEKDEELNSLMAYLKEKISELAQAKKSNSFLQKELDDQHNELKNQTYELEQNIIQYMEIIEKQSKKIKELEGTLEQINKQYQENSLMEILRRSEWNQIKSQLESTILQRNQKINSLSIQIIQKDISSKKNSENLMNLEKSLETCSKELFNTFIKLEQSESLSTVLQKQNLKKSEQLERSQLKINDLKEKIQENVNNQTILQGELKKIQTEKNNLSQLVQQYQSECYLKDQENSILQDKITSLNYEIKRQSDIQFQLNGKINLLKINIANLEQFMNKKEAQQLKMKIDAQQFFYISKRRIEEMFDYLKEETHEIDQTDRFEVLEEENYQEMKKIYQNKLQSLRKIVEEYDFEVKSLARKQKS